LRRRDHALVERQRTLQGLLDWSYDLLDPDEQAVLRRLSIFVGSFDALTAAAAVGLGELDADDVTELIWSLADKSLVNVVSREGSTRYQLLETVRAVAASYSEQAGDAAPTRAALGGHYLATFPFDSRGNLQWRTQLAIENATMANLVDRLVEDGELDIAYPLARLAIEAVSHRREARLHIAHLVDGTKPDGAGLARLHITVAKILAEQGDVASAERHVAEAERLIAIFGDTDALGLVVVSRARSQIYLRDSSDAALGRAERELRDLLAGTLPPEVRADSLVELSMVSQSLDESVQYLQEAAAIAEQQDDHFLRMTVLTNLAEVHLRRGNTQLAAVHQREAMHLSAQLGFPLITAFGLILAARIAQPQGLDALAVRIHAAADVLLHECGFALIPDDQAMSDATLDAARLNLGAQFDAEIEVGRTRALADVLAEAEQVFDRAIESPADEGALTSQA
jgi:tetratricopeptide (TPR) repeat protein